MLRHVQGSTSIEIIHCPSDLVNAAPKSQLKEKLLIASEIVLEENNEPKTGSGCKRLHYLFTFHELAINVVRLHGASMSEKNKNLLDNNRVLVMRIFVEFYCAENRLQVPKPSDVTVKMSSFLITKRAQKRKLEKEQQCQRGGNYW
ncbi:hypothetical protein BV898_15255 [Hypsibius exemplaris]|uniref:Uncharacterized protein n=1 Tax=Hypsibius exemplaris TaxID=2072580 RepID=A0A9X6RK63_HYPEX|nr:hypothetical protein BV898_15255 [Hypsibius exemplaris]